MTSPEDKICPRCGKEIKSSGTLTQWILGCQCGLETPEAEASEKKPVVGREFTICLNCGKRIEAGRPGSLTQWVFRADICSCPEGQRLPSSTHILPDAQQNPALLDEAQGSSGEPELPEFDMSELPQTDLQVSSNRFPVERYAAKAELGKGSTGTVYLAGDRLLNKAVAVKCLNILTDEEMVAFQREAKATSRLDHPNIIKVMDFGATDAGSPYMVMEYFPGISLERYLEQHGKLDVPFVLALFMQIADCLAYAHKQGVFHRDIKPSNILLNKLEPTRSIKIIDFGVAQVKAKDQEPTVYQGKNIVGTPRYMAPDQVIGEEYDERSEIYSLGSVLFECLAGQPPFEGETALETIYKQVNESPPSLTEIDEETQIPEKLEKLISSMLEKKPNRRPADMTTVRQSLRAILEPDESPINKAKPVYSRNQRIAVMALLAIAIPAAYFFVVSYMTPKPQTKLPPKAKTEEELVQETASKFFIHSTEFGDVHSKMLQPLNNLDKKITDADLEYLAKSKLSLRQISLSHTDITGDGLVYLIDSNVHTIDLSSRKLTKQAFKYLSQMKTLKRIALDNTNIDDEDLILLAENLEPHSIYLRVCSKITDKGISALSNLHNLHKIDLEGTALTDKGLLALSRCTELTDIFFNKTRITDRGLKSLSTLKKLQGLSIGECTNLTERSLPLICKTFRTMDSLDISNNLLGNCDFSPLVQCKNLRQLVLNGIPVTDKQMKELGKVVGLKRIYFQGAQFSDAGLKELYNLKDLRLVTMLDCPNITKAGLKELSKNVPKKCQLVSPLMASNLPGLEDVDAYLDVIK